MLEKEYYKLNEAASILECSSEDIIHLGANDKLPIFALAYGWWVELYYCDYSPYSEYDPEERFLHVKEDFRTLGPPFPVSGPVRLYTQTLKRYEASHSAAARRFVAPRIDDGPEGIYEYRLCAEGRGKPQRDVALSTCVLVVTAKDLQALKDPQLINSERPLGKRERDTLLNVIAALAKVAKIDLSMPTKAAGIISKQTELMGTKVATRTIENHIKQIPSELRKTTKP